MRHIPFFVHTISDFYKNHGRDYLPWRKDTISAYEVWVSEVMLQQTQVSRVIPYYMRFILRFPDIYSLAKASWEDFLPYYAGLGYYARGKNMLSCALELVSSHGGQFPRDVSRLKQLPGIGEYTAKAIAAFAYGGNEIPKDTNIQKVVGRFYFGNKKAAIPGSFLKKLRGDTKALSMGLMDFANSICLSRPKCAECPLARYCAYARADGKRESVKKPSIQHLRFPSREARVFLYLHERHHVYYSPTQTKFSVFVLPPTHNSRKKIKQYFRQKYHLQLSVRPPHKKELTNGIPTLFVNAQILSGRVSFAQFVKKGRGFVAKQTC